MPQPRTLEGLALSTLKAGKFFYTEKPDKDIIVIALNYGRKIKTERLAAMDCKTHSEVTLLTKVTLL